MSWICKAGVFSAFLLGSVTSAQAGEVSCAHYYLAVADAETPVMVTVPPQNLIAQCTASDGATLYLVMPSDGINLTLEPHSQATVQFTVQNAEGEQASAQVLITRS